MTAVVLDGKATAAAIKAELSARVDVLRARGVTPGLGTLLVGDDPASQVYVAGKHRDCAEVGIESVRVDLSGSSSAADVRRAITDLNSASEVTGYIVQLPLPAGLDEVEMLGLIDPAKDADGLHPENLGHLVLSTAGELATPLPCTPAGIVELLRRYDVPTRGARAVIVGRGVTVGRPLSLLMSRKDVDATVTIVHTGTVDPEAEIRRADIVVAAVGRAGYIPADWVKPGAALLDVGVTRRINPETGKAKIYGDIDPAAREVAGFMAPNPGGVGPMTRAMLLANVVRAAEHAADAAD